MSFEIVGNLHKVFDTQTISDKFKKREFVLETKDGNYMQPMLIDQLKYLYNMISRADQVLGKDAYNRYKELSLQLEKITMKQLSHN